MTNKKTKIIVFGASEAGRSAYARLRETNQVVAFYDNDPTRQETSLFGLPVLSPQVPLACNAEKVVITGSYAKEMYVQLTEGLGLDPHLIEYDGRDGLTFEWLFANKRLRMDPKLDIWAKSRRDFHLDRYRFAAELVKGRKTLDVACGTGYGSHLLAKTAAHVCGVDVDKNAVEYANEHYGCDGITFRKHFAEILPFEDGSFDAIVSFETIEHVLCPDALLKEFVRLLSPDGILILSTPNEWGYTPHHFTDFNYEMLKYKIDKLFDSATFYYNNSGTREGRGEKGIGVLDLARVSEAECFLVVAKQPRHQNITRAEHMEAMLSEIYEVVYQRHQHCT